MNTDHLFLYLEHYVSKKHAVNYNQKVHAQTMYVIKSVDATLFTLKFAHCWMPASHLQPQDDCGVCGFLTKIYRLWLSSLTLCRNGKKKKQCLRKCADKQPHTQSELLSESFLFFQCMVLTRRQAVLSTCMFRLVKNKRRNQHEVSSKSC